MGSNKKENHNSIVAEKKVDTSEHVHEKKKKLSDTQKEIIITVIVLIVAIVVGFFIGKYLYEAMYGPI